jgi:hypothetical protein
MKPRVSLVCFNPQGRIELPAATGLINPRMENMKGKTIGIIWDGKAGGDNFCIAVEELLKERFPTATTIRLVWGDAEAAAKAKKEMDTFIYGVADNGMGGWIPELLLPHSQDSHVGSIDVDLALNHRQLTESGYRAISEILSQSGYFQDKQQPFMFRKEVHGQTVKFDFLAGEYGGTGKSHRTQKILEMRPRKARGCDVDQPRDLAKSVTVE